MTVEATSQQLNSNVFNHAAGIPLQSDRTNNNQGHIITPQGYTVTHGQVLRRDRAMPVYPLDGSMVQALAANPGLIPLVASQSADLPEVPVRSNGIPSEWDMTYIRRLSPEPDALDPSKLYVFESAPSTQFVDSLLTRMAESSLKNYVMDAFGGVAVMNSHRAGGSSPATLPVGRSFFGTIQDDPSNPGTKRFVAISYILRNNRASGENTDDIISAIQAGTLFDLSIGFRFTPGTPQKQFKDRTYYRCSICNADWQPAGDMMPVRGVGDNGKDCNHWPGEVYGGNLCSLWVENAHLGEFSFVYGGATDAAVILKARKAAKEGRLSRAQVSRLEGIYHARISAASTFTRPMYELEETGYGQGTIPDDLRFYDPQTGESSPDDGNGYHEFVEPEGAVSESTTNANLSTQQSPTNVPALQLNNDTTRSDIPVPPQMETTDLADADVYLRNAIVEAIMVMDIPRAQALMKEIAPDTVELPEITNLQPAGRVKTVRSELNTAARDNLKDSDFADPANRKFPILDQDDVDSAAHLIGKAGNPEAVKKRVIAIAKKKGLQIPDAWETNSEGSRSEVANNQNEIEGGEVEMEDEELTNDDSERAVKSRTKVTVDPGDDDFDGEMDDLPDGNVDALDNSSSDDTDSKKKKRPVPDFIKNAGAKRTAPVAERAQGKPKVSYDVSPDSLDNYDTEDDDSEIDESDITKTLNMAKSAAKSQKKGDPKALAFKDNKGQDKGITHGQDSDKASEFDTEDPDSEISDSEMTTTLNKGKKLYKDQNTPTVPGFKDKKRVAPVEEVEDEDEDDAEDEDFDYVAPVSIKTRQRQAEPEVVEQPRKKTAAAPERAIAPQVAPMADDERRILQDRIARFKEREQGFTERMQEMQRDLKDTQRQVKQMKPFAEIGWHYREKLIEETKTYAVRAQIAGLTEERVDVMCERLDIVSLEIIRDDYRSRAEERFSQVDIDGAPTGVYGRQTQAADPNEDYVTQNTEFRAMLDPYTGPHGHGNQDEERPGPFNIAAYR